MTLLPRPVLDHASDPQNRGSMSDPDAVGRANLGGRPPEVTIFLKMTAARVQRAMFEAHGCAYTIACCSVLSELICGKSVAECRALRPEAILDELVGVPDRRRFCATLAVEALHEALRKFDDFAPEGDHS